MKAKTALCLLFSLFVLPLTIWAQPTWNQATNFRTQAPISSKAFATGAASHYAMYLEGQKTTSGEPFKPYELTAAHRFLPMGTRVRVINLINKKETTVRINDRGPFASGSDRIIDLSWGAAQALSAIQPGIIPIEIYVLDPIPTFYYRMPADFESWTVQVISTVNKAYADMAARKLGTEAIVIPFKGTVGETTYRVFYGKYGKKELATAARDNLMARGYLSAFEKYLVDDHPDLAGLTNFAY